MADAASDATSGNDGSIGNIADGGDATLGADAGPADATVADANDGSTGSDAGLCSGGCGDFPASAVIADPGVPVSVAQLFAVEASAATGGPCLLEPSVSTGNSPGALYPSNWVRPIFIFSSPSGQDVYELRLHSSVEANDLVVYTTRQSWIMPSDLWRGLASRAPVTVTVSVTGASTNGGTPAPGTQGNFAIASSPAPGSIVYLTSALADGGGPPPVLKGFWIGDEGSGTVLNAGQVQEPVWAAPADGGPFPAPPTTLQVACIGCHTPTPDGTFVGLTAQWPWPHAIATVQPDAGAGVGSVPPWLTQSAVGNLNPNVNDTNYLGGSNATSNNNVDAVELGMRAYSPAHYTSGDRIEIATVGSSLDQPNGTGPEQSTGLTSQLAWIDLEYSGSAASGRPSASPGAADNGGWGLLLRAGDGNGAAAPDWSHDGTTIAYTSTNATQDGRLATGTADIRSIPYAARAGGTSTGVNGASSSTYNEYYPAFSSDDRLLAFNRVGAGASMYLQPQAEAFAVAADGGTALRLASNDPPSCSGQASPGVQNTRPRWAPSVNTDAAGNATYWVVFSSTRALPGSTLNAQLYVSAVVRDASGVYTSYGAIYPWNQDGTTNNYLPDWANLAVAHGTTAPPARP